jgi:hypothetical protein
MLWFARPARSDDLIGLPLQCPLHLHHLEGFHVVADLDVVEHCDGEVDLD